jgi:hypothetical protein
VATSPPAGILLTTLDGKSQPIRDWVTTFHLLLVILDPYTHESSWIVKTAGRILKSFNEADCRVGWLITGTEEHAKEFLGPWASEILTFIDPDLDFVKGIELIETPALVHFDQHPQLVGAAEGWQPEDWKEVVGELAEMMSWSKPTIPIPDDPSPYSGSLISP